MAASCRKGIEQRVQALNAFLYDIYHRQEILKAGRVPEKLILNNSAFCPEMMGLEPARGVYSHIIGVDIVRVGPDEFYVLEDNLRTPSGVSYMLEDREAMMQLAPDLFQRIKVAPVENYPENLRRTLESVAPAGASGVAQSRGADAGHLQLGLFRALVPRRPDGRRAVRGAGPLRRWRQGLYADHHRAASGST